VRIISGIRRGQNLKVPTSARATTDRVREAIFSILEEPEEMVVLDLYAGSGSLGLEALSRGARSACFVDISRHAQDAIRDNLREKDLSAVRIIKQDALDFLRKSTETFDWIFCDPPYDGVDYTKLLQALIHSTTLGKDSLLILESDRYHALVIPEELELIDKRKFGDTIIHFLKKRPPGPRPINELPPAS
jgi:16S rRNA (guanine966-N2)-methyltransferase